MSPYRTPPSGASLLDRVTIATPCDERWEDMRGDDRVRFCARCGKHVFDVSTLTRAEAEALLLDGADAGVLPCMSIFRRSDGTIITSDCDIGIVQRTKRRVRLALVVAGVAAVDWPAFAAPIPSPLEPQPQSTQALGRRRPRGEGVTGGIEIGPPRLAPLSSPAAPLQLPLFAPTTPK